MQSLVAPYLTEAGRAAFRALAGLSASTVLAHACAVGVLLLLARTLPPAQFGALSVALTVQGYLVLLGSLACGSVVIREAVRRPDDIDTVLTSLLAITGTASVLVCGIALVATALAPVSGDERWLLSLVAVGSVPAAMAAHPLFDAHHRQARAALVAALAEVLALVLIAGLWWAGALGLLAAGAVYAAKWTLTSAGQWLVYHASVRPVRWRWSAPNVRLIARASWPILFAALLFFVPLSLGVVLVRLRGGPDQAALFGLAYQVANAYQIFAALGVQVVQPHVYGEYGLHRQFLAKLGLFAVIFLGGSGVLTLTVGWSVVVLLLPPFYRPALATLPWLVSAVGLLVAGRVLSAYLLRFGDGPFILGAHLVGALAYVAAFMALPTDWVTIGAAVLAPCAALVSTAAFAVKVRSRIREVTER